MDRLVEQIDNKSGRKVYRYIRTNGEQGKLVSRRQHLVDLKAQGKLLHIDIKDISFKRMRSHSLDASTKFFDDQIIENDLENNNQFEKAARVDQNTEHDMFEDRMEYFASSSILGMRDRFNHNTLPPGQVEDYCNQGKLEKLFTEQTYGDGGASVAVPYMAPEDQVEASTSIPGTGDKFKLNTFPPGEVQDYGELGDLVTEQSCQGAFTASLAVPDMALEDRVENFANSSIPGMGDKFKLDTLPPGEVEDYGDLEDLVTEQSYQGAGTSVAVPDKALEGRVEDFASSSIPGMGYKFKINTLPPGEVEDYGDLGELVTEQSYQGACTSVAVPDMALEGRVKGFASSSIPGLDFHKPSKDSLKAKRKVVKKVSTLKGLKFSPGKEDIRAATRLIEQFRAEEVKDSSEEMKTDFKEKLIKVLSSENCCSYDHFCKILLDSKEVRDFLSEDLIQESLCFGGSENVLKQFPPDLTENMFLKLLNETKLFAPNLLAFLIKVCSKPNEPVDEKQTRKLVQLISQILSCLNQKDSAIQKLIALKLKLCSITSSGLDFLKDLGITQSSRSWQKDCDYLAGIDKEYLVQELRDSSYSFLVDNLDKVIDGELTNFTSVILIADRGTDSKLSDEVKEDVNFFDPDYLKLDKELEDKYMNAVIHIVANALINISPDFTWIRGLIPKNFEHSYSATTNKPTFWSYVALLPLSEQKNADMVEILSFLNEFNLDVLIETSEDPDRMKNLIAVLKDNDSSDEEVSIAESELVAAAKKKGLPLIIGDQLTYERAFIGKELRKGNITAIERFDLLQLRLAMFHLLMAKVRRDYSEFLPSLTNVLDRGNLAFFRARLSKHEISNDGSKIKKGEKHTDSLNFAELIYFR